MNKAIKSALIIGGGFSGMSAAIELRKRGIDVEVVELDPEWSPLGTGITLSPPTLRALEVIGVADEVGKYGFCAPNLDIRSHDGHPIAQIPTPTPANSNQTGAGILRPDLAKILAKATRESGTRVRLGVTYKDITHSDQSVKVSFTDGTEGEFDLVIGADGLHSKLRDLLFPGHTPPSYTKQACWRAVLNRPKTIERPTFWIGPVGKIGANPISEDKMYMFINEYRESDDYVDPSQWRSMMIDLIQKFPAPELQEALAEFDGDIDVDFRPLYNLLLPRPWHKSRVVLIGDAVHATTPHLASGAGIGIESAIVLAEELGKEQSVDDALQHFEDRRWERCRLVVENSARLVEIENAHGDKSEHSKVVSESMGKLANALD
ncbi:FAD-dependent oxidoreductase [Marinimicrobium alkaliphilum]|uniref:FAD-dependent oxidoreductase n=1 Tax=Marinimicrobium alkaliphilum TaxID=2202654 RepID=UPI000DBA2B32|nr:FAD-dependent oxidoreductase [Marinimicrobium alkaliphilum]